MVVAPKSWNRPEGWLCHDGSLIEEVPGTTMSIPLPHNAENASSCASLNTDMPTKRCIVVSFHQRTAVVQGACASLLC